MAVWRWLLPFRFGRDDGLSRVPIPLTSLRAAAFNKDMPPIRPLLHSDLEALRRFTDREIGAGYYTSKELEDIFQRSQKNGVMFSFVLLNKQNEIEGARLTYPPQKWDHGKGRGLHPELWPHALEFTAYFQSLFLASSRQGHGLGGELAKAALARLKETGSKGVVCHSWKESPHDSSNRYLLKLGFKPIAEHPNYWKNVLYLCPRCQKPPCVCTAQEMYLDLERAP